MKSKGKKKTKGINLQIDVEAFKQVARDELEGYAKMMKDPVIRKLIKSCGVSPDALARDFRKDKAKI